MHGVQLERYFAGPPRVAVRWLARAECGCWWQSLESNESDKVRFRLISFHRSHLLLRDSLEDSRLKKCDLVSACECAQVKKNASKYLCRRSRSQLINFRQCETWEADKNKDRWGFTCV